MGRRGERRCSITNATNATHVRLVAYVLDEAVDFDLPVYRLSAGRWLINEKGRAYLLDEQCREFKLKDRKSYSSSFGEQQIPLDGRIRLSPGQAFEATLVFHRLSDQTRAARWFTTGAFCLSHCRPKHDEPP